jgi:hypothetical protein
MELFRAVQAVAIAGAVLLSTTGVAFAHHSFAVYDHTRTLTLRGTVTKFQWTNPHAFIELGVKQADGSVNRRMPDYTLLEYVCEDNREYADDRGLQKIRVPGK